MPETDETRKMSHTTGSPPAFTVIFLHIPKTAGSTMHGILERQYGSSHVYGSIDRKVIRFSDFASLPVEARIRIRLIKGHMQFGIHEYVPNPYTYVTVLRHPVHRVVSHYYFVRRSPKHPLYPIISSGPMSLMDYVSSGICVELNNGQVRDIVGPEALGVPYGKCDQSMLDRAVENLESHFSVVGISERFDETLLLMKRCLGWNKMPIYVSRNVSKNKALEDMIDPGIARAIEDYNELDLELYHRIRGRFDDWVEHENPVAELARLRAWNAVLEGCTYPARAVRTSVRRWWSTHS